MLSGIVGRAAFSAGQFHYQSDGYRENNDVETTYTRCSVRRLSPIR